MYADVVIVGAGLAGIITALQIHSNKKVIVLAKKEYHKSNSYLAQGGIAATLSDDYKGHIEDTMEIGHHLNNFENVSLLVNQSKEAIHLLEKLGVTFDRSNEGYRLTCEGGHKLNRILHIKDQTGKGIMISLLNELQQRTNIELHEDTRCIDLIVHKNTCYGIQVIKDDYKSSIYAKHTVLATGGIGGIFQQSTNIDHLYGDGIAIASRHNAKLTNMEFIQYHPTAFYDHDNKGTFLISESVRGEGAYLVDANGERFMFKYHPKGELAGRDIVSQAITTEMKNASSPCVYLDLRHMDHSYIEQRFPYIQSQCRKMGFDLCKDLIPVMPVQHYLMGGIQTDKYGRTSINKLYACGECAHTGIHGANRLASNSLLECVVFGNQIAGYINANSGPVRFLDDSSVIKVDRDYDEDDYYQHLLQEIKMIISNYCWIERRQIELKKAMYLLNNFLKELQNHSKTTHFYYDCLSTVSIGLAICKASIKRQNSIGSFIKEVNHDERTYN